MNHPIKYLVATNVVAAIACLGFHMNIHGLLGVGEWGDILLFLLGTIVIGALYLVLARLFCAYEGGWVKYTLFMIGLALAMGLVGGVWDTLVKTDTYNPLRWLKAWLWAGNACFSFGYLVFIALMDVLQRSVTIRNPDAIDSSASSVS